MTLGFLLCTRFATASALLQDVNSCRLEESLLRSLTEFEFSFIFEQQLCKLLMAYKSGFIVTPNRWGFCFDKFFSSVVRS